MHARTAPLRAVVLGFLLVFALAAPRAIAQGCQPGSGGGWAESQFNLPGVDGTIHAMAVFDDGSGEALYVGGDFRVAGPVRVEDLARWDGQRWSAVASTPSKPYAGSVSGGPVRAMAVYDDGSGPALYVAGQISVIDGVRANFIARWDGRVWQPLGDGLDRTAYALAVHDDGDGPALYVGGEFMRAGGENSPRLARWDARGWSAVGAPASFQVRALATFDDGSGPALHAAYDVRTSIGLPAERVSKWDGRQWSPLGDTDGRQIFALTVHDDGSGPALYAGGSFAAIDGVPANRIARWDGERWGALGGGLGEGGREFVFALASYDDGDGNALFAGGDFTSAGASGEDVGGVARWDGDAWSAVGATGRFDVRALEVFDVGSGPVLVAGGNAGERTDLRLAGIGLWDGAAWSVPAEGASMGLDGSVNAMKPFNDGSGSRLAVGGHFVNAGGTPVRHVALWDGHRWQAMGDALNSSVAALEVFDDGTGPALYAGGAFTAREGRGANHVARWDGSNWVALGEGLNGVVNAMAVYDDGDGPDLYVAGDFTQAGGQFAAYVARWDGSEWSAVGEGRDQVMNRPVKTLEVYDRGDGPLLIAGGDFRVSGGNLVARWDGQRWGALRFGLGADATVRSLASYAMGGREMLFAGGDFLSFDGEPMARVARWDGVSWHPVGTGLPDRVDALVGFDDGTGPAVYAAGRFTTLSEGQQAFYIARWDGVDWSPLGSGMDYFAREFAVYDDGDGPDLYVGGLFTAAGGVASTGIARWNACDPCPADLDGDDVLTVFDFLAFINLYNSGDSRADFDGDGELTVLDFLAFQSAFGAGC